MNSTLEPDPRILSSAATHARFEAIRDDLPYIYELRQRGRSLMYFGTHIHTSNPTDPVFDYIVQAFDYFLKETRDRSGKRIVAIEGGIGDLAATREEAKRLKENGFTRFLATERAIQVASPEPPAQLYIADLARAFDMRHLVYFSIARMTTQALVLGLEPDAYHRNVFERMERDWEWAHHTLADVEEVHSDVFGGDFPLYDYAFFRYILEPRQDRTEFNRIADWISERRNSYALRWYGEQWRAGKSIFSVYGNGHAVSLEHALRDELAIMKPTIYLHIDERGRLRRGPYAKEEHSR